MKHNQTTDRKLLEDRYLPKDTLRLYWQSARAYKKWFFIPMVLGPLGVFTDQILSTYIIGLILGKIAGQVTQLQSYAPLFLILVICFALKELFWRSALYFMNRIDGIVIRDLIVRAYENLLAHSARFHNDSFAGALVTKANRFAGSFEPLYDTLIFDISTGLTVFIAGCVAFGLRLPSLLFAFIGITVVFVFITSKLVKKRTPLLVKRAASETHRTANLADGLTNIHNIKSFAAEKSERMRFFQSADTFYKKSILTWDYQNVPIDLFAGAVTSIIRFAAILFAVVGFMHGKVNVTTAYFLVSIINNLTQRIWEFSRVYRNVDRALADAKEMTEIMKLPVEVIDNPNALDLVPADGSVSFNNMTFWYAERTIKHALFKNFNLHIQSGEKVGLVGPSGGGKTTITKLLLRFMDIQDGSIKISGQDTASVSQQSLRDAITYVPQEPLLFHRSLAENISYGKPDATQEEIVEAAKKAHAHEFIEQLPNGYDTLVGERGVKLSGGQRQRVAIARAMIKDAPILVLDEATSALDSESEKLIQDALWKLMEGKTTIVIAHRLSTIQHMDRIVVLDDGKIVEEGSHTSLVSKKKGLYAKLWAHQSGGFLED